VKPPIAAAINTEVPVVVPRPAIAAAINTAVPVVVPRPARLCVGRHRSRPAIERRGAISHCFAMTGALETRHPLK